MANKGYNILVQVRPVPNQLVWRRDRAAVAPHKSFCHCHRPCHARRTPQHRSKARPMCPSPVSVRAVLVELSVLVLERVQLALLAGIYKAQGLRFGQLLPHASVVQCH